MARGNTIVSAAVVIGGGVLAYAYRDKLAAMFKQLGNQTTASFKIDLNKVNVPGTGQTAADLFKGGFSASDLVTILSDQDIPGTGQTGRDLLAAGFSLDQILYILQGQSADLVNGIAGGAK